MRKQKLFKLGDRVKLFGCPFDEQIAEEAMKYAELKGKEMTVLKVKKVNDEGTSGQWIQTDKMVGWIDKTWFRGVATNENTKKS